MLHDPELSALIAQAARNLDTLELLVRSARDEGSPALDDLRRRLRDLKLAYTRETDVLTREVLARALDRRTSTDRRRTPEPVR